MMATIRSMWQNLKGSMSSDEVQVIKWGAEIVQTQLLVLAVDEVSF